VQFLSDIVQYNWWVVSAKKKLSIVFTNFFLTEISTYFFAIFYMSTYISPFWEVQLVYYYFDRDPMPVFLISIVLVLTSFDGF